MSYKDVDPKVAARLFEVKKNQLKMVQRRGYNIEREKHLLWSRVDQFLEAYIPFARQQKKSFRAILTGVYQNDEGKRITVYYADVSKGSSQLGTNEVEDATDTMDKYKSRDGIIITPKPLSPSAAKKIEGLPKYNIQVFLESEMGYDPTEHFLVPRHIPLKPEEQREYLQRNKISVDQLPVIKASDIIIKYLGVRPGTVVRIERENMFETMIIHSVAYKIVKED